MIKSRNLDASGKQIAVSDFHNFVQRALNSVVYGADQPGAKLDGQRFSGGLHRFPGPEALCLFINLYGSLIAVHFDNFSDQPFSAYPHDIVHICVAHAFSDHQRSGDFSDCTCAHSLCSPFIIRFQGQTQTCFGEGSAEAVPCQLRAAG